jgi:uncharacterized membrane protein YdjX (TVP38/TMEM64 family)
MGASAHARLRRMLLVVWVGVALACVYVLVFRQAWLASRMGSVASSSLTVAGGAYLLLGCIRGFTLVPSTTLILIAIPFFPPGRLFVLTMIGILVSGASVYWFAEALHVEELLTGRRRRHAERLTVALQRWELPVIIGWSFLPFVPTDVIGYVCGALRVDFRKYLVGIGIGEGAICAIYIFLGGSVLQVLPLNL